MNKRRINGGFTIVELLIVVVVIAILATIVIVAYNGIQDRTRQSSAQQSLSTVSKKIQTTLLQENALPASLAAIGVTDSSSVAYQYTPNTAFSPATYCLTATSGKYSYHIATNGAQTDGPCPNHTGEAPTINCATGYVAIPGNSLFGTKAFCAMKYEAKDGGGSAATSVAAGTPWTSVTQPQARTYSENACTGCRLMTLNEWLTIAHNLMNVPSNWSGGAVGSGSIYTGHNDGSPATRIAASTSDSNGYYETEQTSGTQRRTLTLSNGEVIWDFSGNVWEVVDQTTSGAGRQPGRESDSTEVYKDWTVANILTGDFPQTFPGYGSALAATNGWNSGQGLGQMITNHNASVERSFIMGGAYTTGYVNSGLFTLRLNYTPTQVSSTSGFRASYTP